MSFFLWRLSCNVWKAVGFALEVLGSQVQDFKPERLEGNKEV